VRVTGTVFNVRAESAAALEVLVVEGHVQVRPGDSAAGHPVAPVQLGAGDLLSAGPGGVAVQSLSAGAMEDALAWRHGQVVFKGVHLSAALARFARYHGRGITASPDVADFSVGGLYSLDDLDGFLGAMEAMYPVRVTRDLNGTVQVGPAVKAETAPVHGNR
jgi:transmembrane sensor